MLCLFAMVLSIYRPFISKPFHLLYYKKSNLKKNVIFILFYVCVDINLLKAFVMVSKLREVAICWRKMAQLLNIAEEEIDQSADVLCQEEKCFMVFKKWLETSEVTFKMLTLLMTTMGFRVIAGK